MTQASLDMAYRALSDGSRRTMLRQLARTPSQTVSELCEPLAIALPTVLKHIDVLVNAGLVERSKSGRTVTVTLRPDGMAEAMRWLEGTESFCAGRLDRLAHVARKQKL